MADEMCHSDTSPSDWELFVREPPPNLIHKVIDRSEVDLPEWFCPLARGVATASDYLIRKTGYRSGSGRPRDWLSWSRDSFIRYVDSGYSCRPSMRQVVDRGAALVGADGACVTRCWFFASAPRPFSLQVANRPCGLRISAT
jgi:hypothetical protein